MRSAKGFSLVEMTVVIGLIVLLAGLTLSGSAAVLRHSRLRKIRWRLFVEWTAAALTARRGRRLTRYPRRRSAGGSILRTENHGRRVRHL